MSRLRSMPEWMVFVVYLLITLSVFWTLGVWGMLAFGLAVGLVFGLFARGWLLRLLPKLTVLSAAGIWLDERGVDPLTWARAGYLIGAVVLAYVLTDWVPGLVRKYLSTGGGRGLDRAER